MNVLEPRRASVLLRVSGVAITVAVCGVRGSSSPTLTESSAVRVRHTLTGFAGRRSVSDGGNRSTHPGPTYRSASARARAFDDAVAEAMRTPVTDRLDTQSPSASDPPAGTPSPEGDATERVAAVPAVLDAEPDAGDRDRMEHERQARLRRWQAVDPRERRT